MDTAIPSNGEGWVNQIITSSAFDDCEGQALENLNKYEAESGFCVQYFRDGKTNFYGFNVGSNGSVNMTVPHGGDRLLHVHYHPSLYVSPSVGDIHGADQDAAILRNELEIPPVHMIGAVLDASPLYLARQRKKFPGYIERSLLKHKKPEEWHPTARKIYEMESNRLLYEEMVDRLGKEREMELRGRPIEEVLELSGITYTDIAKMNAKALQKSYGYKTGLLGTADKFPGSGFISDRRTWIYGNGAMFD